MQETYPDQGVGTQDSGSRRQTYLETDQNQNKPQKFRSSVFACVNLGEELSSLSRTEVNKS